MIVCTTPSPPPQEREKKRHNAQKLCYVVNNPPLSFLYVQCAQAQQSVIFAKLVECLLSLVVVWPVTRLM
jgi:hypothetical protein